MNLAISLIAALALILQLHHTRQRRALMRQQQRATLRRRLSAVELALPAVEAQYGPHSESARYLRAAQYMTSLKLRNLTPRPRAGRPALGGTR